MGGRRQINFGGRRTIWACILHFRDGGFCAKNDRDAIVKFDSIGICMMLVCKSIGADRAEDSMQIDWK